MILSQGLLISLGFTLVIGILLFVFIRQKTGNIENKIDTLFQLVHEEAAKQHKSRMEMTTLATNGGGRSENISMAISADEEDDTEDDKQLIERISVSSDESSESSLIEDHSSIESVSSIEDAVELLEVDNGSITTSSVTTNDTEDIEDIKTKGNDEQIAHSVKYQSSESEIEEELEDSLNSDTSEADEEVVKSINLGKEAMQREENSNQSVTSDSLLNDKTTKMLNMFGMSREGSVSLGDNESITYSVGNPGSINYKKKTVAELREMARELKLCEDPKQYKKLQLVDMLKEHFKSLEDVEQEVNSEVKHLELNEENLKILSEEEEINMNEVD